MTPDQLLAVSDPEQMFPGDLDQMKKKFHALSRVYHPDRPGGRHDVFVKIASLYELGEQRLLQGRWNGGHTLNLTFADGRRRAIEVMHASDFVLGRQLISEHELFHIIEPAYRKYVDHAMRTRFSYASDRMRDECERYLPHRYTLQTLLDGRLLVSQPKTPDLIRLRDVVNFYGTLEIKHVAWVISSLTNLCCYLEYAGYVHCDISLDTYFISPVHHSGALLGGWWYHQHTDHIVDGPIPKRTVEVLPYTVRILRRATPLIDHELIRLIGRESADLKTAPIQIRDWLHGIASGTAQTQYRAWVHALEQSFGARRFVDMALTAEQVYKGVRS